METNSNRILFKTPLDVSVNLSFEEFTINDFDGVVNLLKTAIPVAGIYNLSKNKAVLDLIIVLEKTCGKTLDTFENLIDISMLGYTKSFCTLHTFGHLNQQIMEGNLFYSAACTENNLIYKKSNTDVLPKPSKEIFKKRQLEFHNVFHIDMNRATAFLDGALNYIQTNQLVTVMFMLHQAVELAYRCFLNLMRGKDIKCHELTILRRNLIRFAPELIGVFSEQEEEELFYLALLEKGYCGSRYNRDYVVDRKMISILYAKVCTLHGRCFTLFATKMRTIASVVN